MTRVFFCFPMAVFLIGLALPLGSGLVRDAQAADTGSVGIAAAIAPVEDLHGVLLAVMKDAKALGPVGRRERLNSPLRAAFDFPRMARLAAGASVRDASPAQEKRFVEAFARVSIATYASRFKGWSGQRFETLGTEPGPRGTVLVQTRIVSPDADPVALTYVVLAEAGQPPRIVDVLLKGSISELSVKRSEYAAILQSEGLDGLSQRLEQQAEALIVP